jgi:DNA invertase Pin-like site-specific DNA recombinase
VKHTAHPYYRWSSRSQSDGDSLRRQEELSARWHASNCDYILGPARVDAGISGFNGANAKRGRLAEFLQEIRDGIVRPGDVLLAESWDRISRDHPYDVDPYCREIGMQAAVS